MPTDWPRIQSASKLSTLSTAERRSTALPPTMLRLLPGSARIDRVAQAQNVAENHLGDGGHRRVLEIQGKAIAGRGCALAGRPARIAAGADDGDDFSIGDGAPAGARARAFGRTGRTRKTRK